MTTSTTSTEPRTDSAHTRLILTVQTSSEPSVVSTPETSGGPDPGSRWCLGWNNSRVYLIDTVSPGHHLFTLSWSISTLRSRRWRFRPWKRTPKISSVFLLRREAWRTWFYLIVLWKPYKVTFCLNRPCSSKHQAQKGSMHAALSSMRRFFMWNVKQTHLSDLT